MEIYSEVSQSRQDSAIVDRVLAAVAEKKGCKRLDLPPLYTVVDPDALRRVLQGTGVHQISFSYHGYSVSIMTDGQVRVVPEEE